MISHSIFQNILDRNLDFIPLFQKKALIAFSGGKDSGLILEFYKFLYQKKISPAPSLFHLNHRIRKNESQELEILEYMKSTGFPTYYKKKMFH
jgi:tRNA(Ile)-lysidine synthase